MACKAMVVHGAMHSCGAGGTPFLLPFFPVMLWATDGACGHCSGVPGAGGYAARRPCGALTGDGWLHAERWHGSRSAQHPGDAWPCRADERVVWPCDGPAAARTYGAASLFFFLCSLFMQ